MILKTLGLAAGWTSQSSRMIFGPAKVELVLSVVAARVDADVTRIRFTETRDSGKGLGQ